MAINLVCSVCKSNSSLRSKVCKSCGSPFKEARKYRVVVQGRNGNRVTKVVDSISSARKLESKLKSEALENHLFGSRQATLIDDIWQQYLAWAKHNKKSWRDDELRWECHVKARLSGKSMYDVTALDVQEILTTMKTKKDYAPATLRHVIIVVKRLFNWSVEMDLYKGENPASRIKLPKLNNEVTECLSKDEISRLLAVLDNWVNQRAALLVKFGLFTGLRRGELFSLKWEDVDLESGMIFLKDTKGGKDSILPLSDEAVRILHEARKLLPDPESPYVFPNRHGKKRTNIGKTWSRIKKTAKISNEFRFHGLRHTYASYLASSGKVSLYTLQKLLTHKSPTMTQRYAHLFDQTLRDGTNVLSTMIG